MSLELKKDCKYALVVPTSMGVRITPVNAQHFPDAGNECRNKCSQYLLLPRTSRESAYHLR